MKENNITINVSYEELEVLLASLGTLMTMLISDPDVVEDVEHRVYLSEITTDLYSRVDKLHEENKPNEET